MADKLDFELAKHFANRLKSINGLIWDDDVALALAEYLCDWCRGAIIDGGRVYSAEAQAYWLVMEAAVTFDRWRGVKPLYELFRGKFLPETRPERLSYSLGEKPPIACKTCGDNGTVETPGGYRYCDCSQGDAMAADPKLGEKWLELLNGSSRTPKKIKSSSEPNGPWTETPEQRWMEDRQWVRAARVQAEAVLADPKASRERKEIAREELRTLSGEKKKVRKGRGGL